MNSRVHYREASHGLILVLVYTLLIPNKLLILRLAIVLLTVITVEEHPDFPQVGALCQPHGAREGFPWPVPEEEAHGNGDQWARAECGAGENH